MDKILIVITIINNNYNHDNTDDDCCGDDIEIHFYMHPLQKQSYFLYILCLF